jgi:hypothetical protein
MRGIGSMKTTAVPSGVGKMSGGALKFGVGKMAGGEVEAKKAGMKAHEGLEKLMASKGKK